MKWAQKKDSEESWEDKVKMFYQEWDAEKQQDRVHLATERIFASAWVVICENKEMWWAGQVEEFKSLVVAGVTREWGSCEFVFDEDKKEITVKAADGRGMELVSGRTVFYD
jgi:hypothetical protein